MNNTDKNIQIVLKELATKTGNGSTAIDDMKNFQAFEDLKAISGDKNIRDTMEYDLEANIQQGHDAEENKTDAEKLDNKYELGFEGNLKVESTSSEFDTGIFKQIGLFYDRDKHTITLDFDAYSNPNNSFPGNFLQNFKVKDQLQIIELYFAIESLRYANQKMYDFSSKHKTTFKILYVIAIGLNIVVACLSNEYFSTIIPPSIISLVIPIITFISYFFTRTLMSTSANEEYFKHMQEALTKLRFIVETVIMGSYKVPTSKTKTEAVLDKKLEVHYKEILDNNNFIAYPIAATEIAEKYLSEDFLPKFLQNINIDLESIYKTKDKIDTKILSDIKLDSEKILNIFNIKISEAVDKIKKEIDNKQALINVALANDKVKQIINVESSATSVATTVPTTTVPTTIGTTTGTKATITFSKLL